MKVLLEQKRLIRGLKNHVFKGKFLVTSDPGTLNLCITLNNLSKRRFLSGWKLVGVTWPLF